MLSNFESSENTNTNNKKQLSTEILQNCSSDNGLNHKPILQNSSWWLFQCTKSS